MVLSDSDVALRQEALDFLSQHTKMVLAVNHKNESPNASVMHYAVGESSMVLYFGTCKSFGKYTMLKDDENVSCVIMDEGMNPVCAVDIEGVAREVPAEQQEFAHAIFKANNKTRWFVGGAPDLVMFTLSPKSIRILDASGDTLVTKEVVVE